MEKTRHEKVLKSNRISIFDAISALVIIIKSIWLNVQQANVRATHYRHFCFFFRLSVGVLSTHVARQMHCIDDSLMSQQQQQ